MTVEDGLWAALVLAAVAFLLYVPLFKPWFGFRRPPGHPGRWWS
jgi:hypothetical protein